ncbi:MAG: GNAT family N-acetyltransferase [Myxococcota bacterium]
MASGRFLIDRLVKLVTPRPVTAYAPLPHELAPGLWALDRQLRFPGGAGLPSRTTIVRLSSGALVVISPPPCFGSEHAAALDSIGVVRQVVAPNTFHYVYAAEFMDRQPDASLLVAPGLRERVPSLQSAGELGPGPPEGWSGELDLAVLGPVRGVSEVVLFHVPTGALILTDLAFNLRQARSFDRIVWRLAGIPDRFGPSRTSRLLLLRDEAEASRCLSRVSEWPIRRIVPAHGEMIVRNAKAQFLKAFARYADRPQGVDSAQLEIRSFRPADAGAVWTLHNEALEGTGAHAGNGPWDEDLRDPGSAYLDPGGEFLVCLRGPELVAMGALRPTSVDSAEIKRMRVAPRLQRRGLGTRILGALEERARSLGFIRLHLDTTVQQTAAQRFYLRHGYREVRRGSVGSFELIFYEKALPAERSA